METIRVSELASQIKKTITGYFNTYVNVQGEASNVKLSGRNLYFSLKDDDGSLIDCVFWNFSQKETFESGDEVIVKGTVITYHRSSKYQLKAFKITKEGKGNLNKRFEKLKEKYQKLGYFDESNKKTLSNEINKIGIITANKADALEDIKSRLAENFFSGKIYIKYCTVQGVKCPIEVSEGIKELDKKNLDVILLARGGGSTEDLMGFSDPKIIEAIYNCKTCVMSAIGHQADYMLSDYVADIRAGTPSIAGEYLTTHQNERIMKYEKIKTDILNVLQYNIQKYISQYELDLVNIEQEINIIKKSREKFQENYESFNSEFRSLINEKIDYLVHEIGLLDIELTNLNPQNIIDKGFPLVKNNENNQVKFGKELKKGNELIIKFSDKDVKVLVL
tara:strand:+ start:133 stop:1308 length:1176 start_codon:yes stop_codon:yes gene_type:complete